MKVVNFGFADQLGRIKNTQNCTNQLSQDKIQQDEPLKLLKELKIKNHNRLVIGSLNVNSLSGKFDQLRYIIGDKIDALIIQETKLDETFPEKQFLISGYCIPYRLDRNKFGGGIIIYVKENIPSKKLNKHTLARNIEGLFIEINLRKSKLLLFGGYRSDHNI